MTYGVSMMNRRSFRRSRKDYPQGVIGIYDNAGQANETVDRYMVVFEPITDSYGTIYPILTMSPDPYYALGVSMHGESRVRPTGGWQSGPASAGKTIAFEDLPPDCQRVVKEDLTFTIDQLDR